MKGRRSFLGVLAVLLIIALLLVACAQSTTSQTTTSTTTAKTLNVGFAAPLTGPVAATGLDMQQAFNDAVSDRNSAGGVTIAGQQYMLNGISRDTQADAAVGLSVAQELVDQYGVKSIMGPFVPDGLGMVSFTEQSKVFLFPLDSSAAAADHPFTFITGGIPLFMTVINLSYIPVHYPQLKTLVTLLVDQPDLPAWDGGAQTAAARDGLNYLGYEKVPITTTDFSSIIQRVLTKNPDIINLSDVTAVMPSLSPLLIKQLRQSGFNGLIAAPCGFNPVNELESVDKQYLNKIILDSFDLNNPISPASAKAICQRYQSRNGVFPHSSYLGQYDVYKAFFDFLNGQTTMDTTAWMQGFVKYKWASIWGIDRYWIGQKVFGIDRVLMYRNQVQEYTNGVMAPSWTAPLPYDLLQ